jgi:tRNA(adenine34) deaminase
MNNKYFDLVYEESLKAFDLNEVPIGCVIVKDDKVITSAFNKKEFNNCALDHAELIAIRNASKILNNWRLSDCDIYISLDPCPMCASAIKQSRFRNVYSALSNSDSSYSSIINSIFNNSDNTNNVVNFESNLDQERFKELLNKFFEKQRN